VRSRPGTVPAGAPLKEALAVPGADVVPVVLPRRERPPHPQRSGGGRGGDPESVGYRGTMRFFTPLGS